jgi:hypothetical protein
MGCSRHEYLILGLFKVPYDTLQSKFNALNADGIDT